MLEGDIAAMVGLAYEAAVGGSTWLEFDASLCRLLGAHYASLRVTDGTSRNLLRPSEPAETIYLAHYRQVDPYRTSARIDLTNSRHVSGARLGEEIILPAELHRNEYYADFARPNGRHHMLGGMIDLGEGTPSGFIGMPRPVPSRNSREELSKSCCRISGVRCSFKRDWRSIRRRSTSGLRRSMRCQSARSSSIVRCVCCTPTQRAYTSLLPASPA